MQAYNKPFFRLYENLFIILRSQYEEGIAINLFTEIMHKGLREAYGDNFEKGDIYSFQQLVGARDESVGLQVEFETISYKQFIYRFCTDPMPGLKGFIDPHKLDSTYIPFKISHILGDGWSYKTEKHFWHGHDYTEHIIFKL